MKLLARRMNWLLPVMALLAVLGTGPAGRAGQGVKPAAASSTDLVWPVPPDKPRIRFLETFTSNFDIEPRKKRSWVDRLVGNADPNKAEYFEKPAGVATDSRGRLLIASMQRGTVFVLDKDRREVSRLQGDRGVVFKNPLGLAVDRNDNLFVSDPMLKMVLRFDSQHRLTATFGQQEGMQNPTFLALDEGRRRLFVVDSHLHQERAAVLTADLKRQVLRRAGPESKAAHLEAAQVAD